MNRITPQDIVFLKTALRLAKKGLGWTFPNPMVGAVVVKRGKVIGQGYHRRAGLPHAEIEALRATVGSARGATLYVNLEPCSHYGRTPPCVDAIVKAGISKVVCCTPDPNPKVCGTAIKRLRQAGINVSVGGLAEEAESLNEAFFAFHHQHRPFIAIKFAASLDGKIATSSHDSHWITNEQARNFARNLRRQYQAVLVGINTILRDNPHLGVRAPGKPDPLRIVLDSTLRLPMTSQVLRDKNVLIFTTRRVNPTKCQQLIRKGISLIV
ncbi:MAG: bifunctional diaminohydroxyphosphoribosylaminopyrimidine deaminase/5-amino-6-(5-phosphoribosylamino)uracil reductase RibD, partial [Bacteroidota bacterium]